MSRSSNSRRTFLSSLGAAAAWLVTAPAAEALAGQPGVAKGDPCRKAGRERKVGNKTFACTERNGRLRWQPKKVEATQTSTTVRVLDASALAVGASRVVNVSDPKGGTSGVVVTVQAPSAPFAMSKPFPAIRTCTFCASGATSRNVARPSG